HGWCRLLSWAGKNRGVYSTAMSAILSPRFRYRYLPRLLAGLGVAAIAALLVFLASHAASNNSGNQSGTVVGGPANAQEPPQKARAVPAGARTVAKRFLVRAVGRGSLAKAWATVAPHSMLRDGVTHASWVADRTPIPPLPKGSTARFHIDHSY